MDKSALNKKAKEIIADVLAVDEKKVVPEASFEANLGADSLDYTAMISAFEEEFGVKIQDEELKEIKKVEDVIKMLSQKLGFQE